MKKKEITISDITCMSCVSKIEKQLYSNTSLDKITINNDISKSLEEENYRRFVLPKLKKL